MGCKPSSTSVLMALGANRNILHANTAAVLRQALQGIDIKGKGQVLDIQCVHIISGVDAQYIADFLQRHADAVSAMSLCFRRQLSSEAIETFRGFFAMTLLDKIVLIGKLGNETGGHLLSGLHDNSAVSKLALSDIGLEGELGGGHLSALLQNNSHLKSLICLRLSLGLEGARSLQSSLRINDTLQNLALHTCALGDEGTLVIVNALIEHNRSIVKLCLGNNHITSNGLPHITRLLQSKKSLTSINLCSNAGLFDDQENTKHFARALILQKSKPLRNMNLSRCRLSANALIAIFLATINTLTQFYGYDHVQLEGKDLERLLKILPRMTKLHRLHINLEFKNESVVSSFHENTRIRHLHGEANEEMEISDGPVFCIVERNRWLYKAHMLRKHELQWNKMVIRGRPPLFGEGLWIKSMERITRGGDNINNNNTTGATAIYQILQEKLVMWAKNHKKNNLII